MKCYMIGYDLNKPGQDYKDLIEAIKRLADEWCHDLDSTWFVVTDMSAVEIRNYLSPYLDSSDKLIVAKLAGEAAWVGFSAEVTEWLKSALTRVAAWT